MSFLSKSLLLLTLGVIVPDVHAVAIRPRASTSAPVCHEDNQLRALERYSDQADRFCPEFLRNGINLPQQFSNINPDKLSSACSCYQTIASDSGASTTASYPTLTAVTGGYQPSGFVTGTATSANTAPTAVRQRNTTVTLAGTGSGTGSPVSASVGSGTRIPFSTSAAAKPTAGGSNYPPQPPGAGPGKRGLCYDGNTQVGWSTLFDTSKNVTFGSNWNVIRGSQLDDRFAYVPTIEVDSNLNNADWNATVPVLIEGGTKTMFASNEPDNAGQANLTPSQAAVVYKRYMQPYFNTVQLGTPAVTNGGGSTGLNYLEKFVGQCTGCTFNFINIHYYLQRSDVNTTQYAQALKDYIDVSVPAVQAKHPQLQGLQVFIGEWWLWNASEDEGGDLMGLLLPYLDGNPRVMGYQAFGGLWKGNFINSDGTGLTPAGQKYST